MTEDNRVNVFLLCVSALELLVLQVFYMRGKVKWEALWVIFIECAAYGAGIVSPGEGIVVFELENGMYIEWLRYAGWILTCPVLLMTLVSMTTADGTKAPTVRLVPLLVCNLTMVLFGITSGSVLAPSKWYIFGAAVCFGGVVFSNVIQCLMALWGDSQTPHIRFVSLWLALTFVGGWGVFPCNFFAGHSGMGLISEQLYISIFVVGDLLSKNCWVAIAAYRNHLVAQYNDEQEEELRVAMQLENARGIDLHVAPMAPALQPPPRGRKGSNSTLILNEVTRSATPDLLRRN